MNADVLRRVEQYQLYLATLGHAERAGEVLEHEDLDFSGMLLEGLRLDGAVVPGSDFTGGRMAGADLYAGNFASCRFTGADLSGATLTKATLCYADFSNALLHGAHLRRTDLDGAVLRGAVLNGADLSGAFLQQADLRGADLRGCRIERMIFDQARVADVDLRGAVGFEPAYQHLIDIGTDAGPMLVEGDAARAWLLRRIHAAAA